MRHYAVNIMYGGLCCEQKKTFRLEDGTQVTSDIGIQKEYTSKLNRQNYQERSQNKRTLFSIDDKDAPEIADKVNVEDDVERHEYVRLLRQAIRKLTLREQGFIIDYFFNDYSLRMLEKKYGTSHTKIDREIKTALSKLRQYITDKNN